MKITKLMVPMVALSMTLNNPNYQVQAMPVSQCIQGCITMQAIGAKWCSIAWINPAAFATCMIGVSSAFTACCISCGSNRG